MENGSFLVIRMKVRNLNLEKRYFIQGYNPKEKL